MGGEKLFRTNRSFLERGSPPRGRGKAQMIENKAGGYRITPAWAGKSSTLLNFSTIEWDHPRVGGEKHIANFDDENGRGSPPRGRGKVAVPARCTVSAGITPAWAGKR